MSLIQELKSRYPSHEFEQDPVTAIIAFTFEGVHVTDPFVTDCARFATTPEDAYDVSIEDARRIFAHNLPLGATYANPAEV